MYIPLQIHQYLSSGRQGGEMLIALMDVVLYGLHDHVNISKVAMFLNVLVKQIKRNVFKILFYLKYA